MQKAVGWNSHDLFKKEADILSQLNHPSIPTFIESFETGFGDNSKSYIVMEYIDGISLKDEQRKKRYTEEEVIKDILEIAKILDYLHNLIPPVIHQDLNLSNIIRKKDGALVLIDFNAVKDVVVKERSDDVSGTYGFIAPEQLMGKAVIASDYYSLGIVILVLLTKKELEEMFDENNELQWRSSLHASNKIVYLLENLLQKDANQRPATFSQIETILLGKDSLDLLSTGSNYKKTKKSVSIEIGDNAKISIGSNVKISIGSDDFENEEDKNEILTEFLIEKFEKETGLNVEEDKVAFKRIDEAAQKAIKDLRNNNTSDISLPFLSANASGPKHLNFTLNRTILEKIIDYDYDEDEENIALLRVLSGMKTKNFFMTKSVSFIGRAGSESDIVINHNSLSRKHCEIKQVSANSFKITDLASTNGVRVNGRKISSSTNFKHKDLLKIGNILLKFMVNGYEGYEDLINKETSGVKTNEKNIIISSKKKKKSSFLYAAIIIAFSLSFSLGYSAFMKNKIKKEAEIAKMNRAAEKIKKNKLKKMNQKRNEKNKKYSSLELYEMGEKYQEKKDYKNANIYFLKSCNKGEIRSCEYLGWNYEKGLGYKKDIIMAEKYYTKACNRKSGYGCNKIAYYIESKSKSKSNLKAARALYAKSCRLKFGLGCNNLAEFYLKGKGGSKSKRNARKYYRLACKYGYKKACK